MRFFSKVTVKNALVTRFVTEFKTALAYDGSMKNALFMRKMMLLTVSAGLLFSSVFSITAHAEYDPGHNIYKTEVYEDGVAGRLESLRTKFPDGKYWCHEAGKENNPDLVSDEPCDHGKYGSHEYVCNSFDGGIQCWGFASKVFYDVFGVKASTVKRRTDIENVKVGDWVRINGDKHSGVVLSRNKDSYTLVEANYGYDDKICWGIVTRDISTIDYFKRSPNYNDVDTKINYSEPCTLEGLKDSYSFTGKDVEPKIKVKNGAETLKKGKDYKVSYNDNDGLGKGEIVIEGIGDYSGTITETFKIRLDETELTAKNTDDKIRLCWNSVAGADGYNVYRKADDEYVKIATVEDATNYFDNGAKTGETYSYQVEAYHKKMKSVSEPVEVTRLQKIMKASVETYLDGNSLVWDKIDGAKEYKILRKINDGAYECIATVDDVNMYLDTDTTEAGMYSYFIVAGSDESTSVKSDELVIARMLN